MPTISHPNKAHETAVNLAEMQRQAAIGVSGSSAAALRAAEIAFLKAVIASCKANGQVDGNYRMALFAVSGFYE